MPTIKEAKITTELGQAIIKKVLDGDTQVSGEDLKNQAEAFQINMLKYQAWLDKMKSNLDKEIKRLDPNDPINGWRVSGLKADLDKINRQLEAFRPSPVDGSGLGPKVNAAINETIRNPFSRAAESVRKIKSN